MLLPLFATFIFLLHPSPRLPQLLSGIQAHCPEPSWAAFPKWWVKRVATRFVLSALWAAALQHESLGGSGHWVLR